MPIYLVHGFRWPRPLIRIHIILQNLEDAAAEWLVARGTTETLLENFYEVCPDVMEHLGNLRFVEQYNPDDLSSSAASQPYAYVADVVEEVDLSVDLDEVRGRETEDKQRTAMTELRNRLAPESKITWYVVVCGDEERHVPPDEDESDETVAQDTRSVSENTGERENNTAYNNRAEGIEMTVRPAPEPKHRGLSKLFGSYKSSKLSKKRSQAISTSGD